MTLEEQFVQVVPTKSVLGREWEALKKEREKQQRAFESAPDKMDYNTSPYRRANFACDKFLSEMMPRILKAKELLDDRATNALALAESNALHPRHGISFFRKDEKDIWSHYALERLRKNLSRVQRQKFKGYHPDVYSSVAASLRTFRTELVRWKFGGQPFDGSQAMHSMFQFILRLHLLEAAND